MIYVRAICVGDFQRYVDALTKIVPWFFALGHTHYARWIPVHLRDLVSLNEVHPNIHAEFVKGNFAVRKYRRVLLLIRLMRGIMHLLKVMVVQWG